MYECVYLRRLKIHIPHIINLSEYFPNIIGNKVEFQSNKMNKYKILFQKERVFVSMYKNAYIFNCSQSNLINCMK